MGYNSPHILGVISGVEIGPATIVMCIAVVMVVSYTCILNSVSYWCQAHKYEAIAHSLYRQLLVLGILSFVNFVFQSLGQSNQNLYDASLSLKFTEIVLLFLLFAFIIQAAQLISLDNLTSGRLRKITKMSSIDLKSDLIETTQAASARAKYYLQRASSWVEAFGLLPSLRLDIEAKILENNFHKLHAIPDKFDFSLYLHFCFRTYIEKVSSMTVSSWGMVVVLMMINLFKLEVIDPHIKSFPSSWCSDSSQRGEFACDDFELMVYASVLIGLLELFICMVYLYSCRSYDRLLAESIRKCGNDGADDDTTDATINNENNKLYVAIRSLAENEGMDIFFELQSIDVSQIVMTGTSDRDKLADKQKQPIQPTNSDSGKQSPTLSGKRTKSGLLSQKSTRSVRSRESFQGDDSSESGGVKRTTTVQDSMAVGGLLADAAMEAMYSTCKMSLSKEEHYRSLVEMEGSWYDRLVVSMGLKTWEYVATGSSISKQVKSEALQELKQRDDADGATKQSKLLGNAKQFRLMVQLAMCLQVLYLSIWATQLIPIAVSSKSGSSALWVVLLSIPVLINYRLMQLIIVKAVVFESVRKLDHRMVSAVFDQTLTAEGAAYDLRTTLRELLTEKKIDPIRWKTYIQLMSSKFADTASGMDSHTLAYTQCALDRYAFRKFLASLDLYFNAATFVCLWNCIDLDLSDTITWDELYLVAFPELRRHFKSHAAASARIHEALAETVSNMEANNNQNAAKWAFLNSCYEFFDVNRKNGFITKENTKLVITNLGIQLSELELNQIFAFVGIAPSNERVTFKQFLGILDPTNPEIDRPSRKPRLTTISLSAAYGGFEQPQSAANWPIYESQQQGFDQPAYSGYGPDDSAFNTFVYMPGEQSYPGAGHM